MYHHRNGVYLVNLLLIPTNRDRIDVLLTLMRELYHYDRDQLNEPKAREALDAHFADDKWARIWLIEVDQLIAGYAVLTFGFSLEYGGRDAIIDELYLRESYRNRGLGKQVMELLRGFCYSEGIKALHLEVFNHNQAAYRFYRNQGFRERDSRFMTCLL